MKALIIVDMQKGFIVGENYFTLISKINNLIKNSNYDKIILTKFKNDKLQNHLYQEKIGYRGLISQEEQSLVVDAPNNSVILEKYGYGLDQKDLEYIQSLNIKEIDVCGIKADACVYAIALQLWDAGIYPNILINYVECDENFKDLIQQVYIKQFGKVDYKK